MASQTTLKKRLLRVAGLALATYWLALEGSTLYFSSNAWTVPGAVTLKTAELVELEAALKTKTEGNQPIKDEMEALQALAVSNHDALATLGHWVLVADDEELRRKTLSTIKVLYPDASPHLRWRYGSTLAMAYRNGLSVQRDMMKALEYASDARKYSRMIMKRKRACERASPLTTTYWLRCRDLT